MYKKSILSSLIWSLLAVFITAANPALDPSFLETMVHRMKKGENIIFVKFGDGEYACMKGSEGTNCDGDSYHPSLATNLKHALVDLVAKGAYIAKWHDDTVTHYYTNLVKERSDTPIAWTVYDLIMNSSFDSSNYAGNQHLQDNHRTSFLKMPYMHTFVKEIKNSQRKKVLVCNKKNRLLKSLFNADAYIPLPDTNWSMQYDSWKKKIEAHVEPNCILLIAGGLCTPVLINDLTNTCDMACFDLGSAFDFLAGRGATRGHIHHSREDELHYYNDVLPKDFFPEKQNRIEKEFPKKKPTILYTAALIKKKRRMRKREYLNSLEILNHFGYRPIIVESVSKTNKTIFRNKNAEVLYTQSNNPRLRNKGVNEFVALQQAFDHYQFDDNDMIVKLTGRYYFTSDSFLCQIEAQPEVDAWVRYTGAEVFTGCIAMRAKYFKEFFRFIDYDHIENNDIGIEAVAADFIDKIESEGAIVHACSNIHLNANLFLDGNTNIFWEL